MRAIVIMTLSIENNNVLSTQYKQNKYFLKVGILKVLFSKLQFYKKFNTLTYSLFKPHNLLNYNII